MFIKIMLCMYVLALLLYALLWQSNLLLPILLAAGITISMRLVQKAFHPFGIGERLLLMILLLILSIGIQYLLAFMQLGQDSAIVGFYTFQWVNYIPVVVFITLFGYMIMNTQTQQKELLPPPPPIEEPIKTEIPKIRYYEIFETILSKGKIIVHA